MPVVDIPSIEIIQDGRRWWVREIPVAIDDIDPANDEPDSPWQSYSHRPEWSTG